MLIKLTGPREGATTVLNGVKFVEGHARIAPAALPYFTKCYAVEVVSDGIGHDAPEGADGERSEVPSGADVSPGAQGAAEGDADDRSGADDSSDGASGEVPLGDGHEDAGERGSEVGEDPLGQAMTQLDPEDNTKWTSSGRPRVSALAEVLGRRVTQEEVEARFEGGERDEVAGQG